MTTPSNKASTSTHNTKNSQTLQSREKKNKEVAQISFLTWLLNEKYSFTFQKPSKLSTVNLCYPDLVEINFGSDSLDVKHFLEEHFDDKFQFYKKTKNQKQAERKIGQLKRVGIHNYLLDITTQLEGITVDSKSTQKKDEQMERIVSITLSDGSTYYQSDIIRHGTEINKLIMDMLNNKSTLTINKGELFNKFNKFQQK